VVVFGGEPLDAGALGQWFARARDRECLLVNMFGITETTVHVTAQRLSTRTVRESPRSVGGPIAGWSVSVRDRRGRRVPAGVLGEIWVAGAGVAAGYLGRPELTAEKFVHDSGERWYRSGDLGRLLPDGRLEHWGRIDRQVSVRGHRVELDEVTAVLLEDPAVAAAAVIVGPDAPDRLFGFVVAEQGVDPKRIRRRAARTLPEHMLPATITCVPALPLTVNGKLDTDALAELTRGPGTRRQPADSGAVDTVRRLWGDLLGVDVGPEDSFFDLGGNSLLATRLTRLLADAGLPALPVRELYRSPTPRGVAGYLAAQV